MSELKFPTPPNTIYLIPDTNEGIPSYVWCDDPAPAPEMDENEAVEYTRTDKWISVDDNFGEKQLLKDTLPNVRTIDIRIRMDGKYYWFEGDYLKKILKHVTCNQIDNDGIKVKLENLQQI